MNSTTDTNILTGRSSDLPGVTLAYEIHKTHWQNVTIYGRTAYSPIEFAAIIDLIVGTGASAVAIPTAVPMEANTDARVDDVIKLD